jgi:hypothetical protein
MSNRNDHSPRPLSAVKAGNKPFPAALHAGGRRVMGRVRGTGGPSAAVSQLAAFFLARRSEANSSPSGTQLAVSFPDSAH